MIKRKQRIERNDDFYFKCCKEDGFTTEQAVKLRYASKQRKKRLANKLQDLNLNMWDISTTETRQNLKAYHNGVEIFNES
jgi:nicotinic acid mononucleotide adenylyltransferase